LSGAVKVCILGLNMALEQSSTHTHIEWNALRSHLILFIVALFLGVVALYASQYYLDTRFAAEKKLQQELTQIEKIYQDSLNAVDILQKSYPRFRDFYARGFLGDEQKLLLINYMHELEILIDIPSLRYQISTHETALTLPHLTFAETLVIYQSEMQLQLGLLHEGDLFQVIRVLHQQKTAALFSIERCTLILSPNSQQTSLKQAKINANCSLKWTYMRLQPPK
jgi:hypothetical protein